jgi:uncharacterized membrane protein YbhN (UPF0104 family)
MPQSALRSLYVLLAVLILALTSFILVRDTGALRIDDIEKALVRLAPGRIWFCVALTGVSFFALGCYDVIATRIVAPGRVSAFLAWFAGAAANGISNTLGFHALTATAVRYRLYRGSGLAPADIARVISLSWTALAFGFLTAIALAMLFHVPPVPWERAAGAILFVTLATFVKWLGQGRQIAFRSLSLPLPSGRVAATQMAVGALEMASAIGALYVLMPSGETVSFAAFSAAYVAAVLLGIASHSPGGLGVFEATMLSLSTELDRAGVLAALLVYRVFYNLIPFVVALLSLAVYEIVTRRCFNSTAGKTG